MNDPKKTMTVLYAVAGALALVAVVLAAYTLGMRKTVAPPENAALIDNAAMPPEGPAAQGDAGVPMTGPESQPATENKPLSDGTEGREEAALAAAIDAKPEWSYRVDGHSKDWNQVQVFAGETEGKWTSVLKFRWNGQKYVYVGYQDYPGAKPAPAKKPAASDKPLTEDDLKDVPREFRPGESTALEAALKDHEDWIGKVQSHSNDWSKVTVWIGPPNSEFVAELQYKWNRKGQYYDLISSKDLPSPQ
jgi:hypothetical protein